jgi:DNA-binding transcriptional LysR family regulator
MDKFSAMQAFVRVVEAGTFTKAADSMGMPKPTVTRLIQTLEQSLDTKLLNRTTRKVTVTADGAAYYERAGRLLGEMEELESSMSRAKASPRGRLKVDIPSSLGMAVVIPALPDFYARYPDIQLELGVSDRPIDILAENVDCVIRGGEITDQSLVARRIGEFYLMSCASPAYLKRHGVPQHPQELAHGHRLIRYFSPRDGKLYSVTLHKDGAGGGNRRLPPALGQRLERRRGGGAGRPGHAADLHLPGPAPHQQRRAGAAVQRLVLRGQAHPRGLPAEPPPEQQGARLCRLDRGAVRQARPDPAQEHAAGPHRPRAAHGRSTRRVAASPASPTAGVTASLQGVRHKRIKVETCLMPSFILFAKEPPCQD